MSFLYWLSIELHSIILCGNSNLALIPIALEKFKLYLNACFVNSFLPEEANIALPKYNS